jgi:hypothetical protein
VNWSGLRMDETPIKRDPQYAVGTFQCAQALGRMGSRRSPLNALARSWEGELHCEPWRNSARTEPRPPGITQSRLVNLRRHHRPASAVWTHRVHQAGQILRDEIVAYADKLRLHVLAIHKDSARIDWRSIALFE